MVHSRHGWLLPPPRGRDSAAGPAGSPGPRGGLSRRCGISGATESPDRRLQVSPRHPSPVRAAEGAGLLLAEGRCSPGPLNRRADPGQDAWSAARQPYREDWIVPPDQLASPHGYPAVRRIPGSGHAGSETHSVPGTWSPGRAAGPACGSPGSPRSGPSRWSSWHSLDCVISNSKMSQNLQLGIEPPR